MTSPAHEYRLRFDPSQLDTVRAELAACGESLFEIRTRSIQVSDDALLRLPTVLRELQADAGSVHLVMDHTPMARRGESLKPMAVQLLRQHGMSVRCHVLGEPDKTLYASAEQAEQLAGLLTGPAAVALGSGTITDVTKHAVHLRGRADCRLILVPTACTVTAYTSSMAVLTVRGVKRSLASRWPDVILADLPTLADAPAELTAAGFGDTLARGVAYGDWYLGSVLGMDQTFTRVPYDMLENSERHLLAHASAICQREPAGVRVLIDALLLAGLAMSVVNQTTPISGWEHVISHYLDLRASAEGVPPERHGRQVGTATLTAAVAYRRLLDEFDPRAHTPTLPDDEQARAQISSHFACFDSPGRGLVDEIWQDYRGKLAAWRQRAEDWPSLVERWPDEVRPGLAHWLREPQALIQAVREVGLPASLTQLNPDAQGRWAQDAVAHAHFVRKRFTLGDFLSAIGWLTPANVQSWLKPPAEHE